MAKCKVPLGMLLDFLGADDKQAYLRQHPELERHLRECGHCQQQLNRINAWMRWVQELYPYLPRDECPMPEDLEAYCDGEVDQERRVAFEKHLEECPYCWVEHYLLRKHVVTEEASQWEMPPKLRDRILAMARNRARVRFVPQEVRSEEPVADCVKRAAGKTEIDFVLPAGTSPRWFTVIVDGRPVGSLSVRRTTRKDTWSGHELCVGDVAGNIQKRELPMRLTAAARTKAFEEVFYLGSVALSVAGRTRHAVRIRVSISEGKT